jgi:hypothetical protein
MILITSAAYVGSELKTEFGAIPPCFLPLANHPIVDRQVKLLRQCFPDERLIISLPESFVKSPNNEMLFERENVECLAVPDGLSLADSILYVINAAADEGDVLRILHGDTLIFDIPSGDDIVAISNTRIDYTWEIESQNALEEIVWCGYFSFGNVKKFTKCLVLSRGEFVVAVRNYDNARKLTRKKIEHWFDFGHISTFFSSREKVTTERSFNNILIQNGMVRKSGSDYSKVEAENYWFRNIPLMLKLKTPQLLDSGVCNGAPYYTTEYLHLVPLNELLVHGRHPIIFWNRIFEHCNSFLLECRDSYVRGGCEGLGAAQDKISADSYDLFTTKTKNRLGEFSRQTGIDLDECWTVNGRKLPSLRDISHNAMEKAGSLPCLAGVMHGDFCFSNILFNSRADAIKVIDPRGKNFSGEFSIFGDLVYDIAKLTHSVIGLYDFILAGAFSLERTGPYSANFSVCIDDWVTAIQKVYMAKQFTQRNVNPADVMPQVILLFLSMLPLHADNPKRQLALMLNAYLLHMQMEAIT